MGIIKADNDDVILDAGAGQGTKFKVDGTEVASVSSTGNLTCTGIDVTGSVTVSNSIRADGQTNFDIYHSTSDGSDTGRTRIGGGGDVTDARGAVIQLYGNENTTADGDCILSSGRTSGTINFNTNGTERMRIDSSGNVLVGTTNPALYASSAQTGIHFNPNSQSTFCRSSGAPLYLNRITDDGTIIQLRRSGTSVGVIGVTSAGNAYFGSDGTLGTCIKSQDGNFIPADGTGAGRDNAFDWGGITYRWDDIYATNGTIQTSDRNEKQDIEELTTAEQNVAVACKGLLRKFRWQDAVAEKGDDARIHFGIIAQDLQDAFTAEGLDAGRYAMFISSTWYEKQTPVDAVEAVEGVEATYDDEGNELTPAVEAVEAKDAYVRTDTEEEPTEGYTERTRLGVRYPELLAFIIAAL